MSYVAKTRAILAAAGHRQGSRLWALADSRLTEGAHGQHMTASEFAADLLVRAVDLPRGWHADDTEPGRYTSQVSPEHDIYHRGVHLHSREVWLSVESRDETTRLIDRPMRDGESLADAMAWLERETPRHDPVR